MGDAGGLVTARRALDRELRFVALARREVFVVRIVTMVVVVMRDDRPVGGVRVVVGVSREVQVRQHLDPEQPQDDAADRDRASVLPGSPHGSQEVRA